MTTFLIVTAPPRPKLLDRLARLVGLQEGTQAAPAMEITIHVSEPAPIHQPAYVRTIRPAIPAKVYSTPTPCTYDDDPLGW